MLETYQKRKSDLFLVSNKIRDFAIKRNDKEAKTIIEHSMDKIQKNQFNLVTLGQLKRGKSTFINSILGKSICYTDILPTSSSIVEIKNSPNGDEAIIHFNDNTTKKIPMAELHAYTTAQFNPNNEKRVSKAEVYVQSEYLTGGMTLVDTPGEGSLDETHNAIAYDYLPKADAAIFLITSDLPISSAEYKFLQEIKKYIHKIFFLLNKSDTINNTDLYKVLQYNKEIIENRLGIKDAKIFPVSAKLALEAKLEKNSDKLKESKLPNFEEVLKEFILNEKGKVFLIAEGKRLKFIIDKLRNGLKLEKKMVNTEIEELLKKKKILEEEIKNQRIEKVRILKDVTRMVNGLRKEIEQRMVDSIESKITKNILKFKEDKFTEINQLKKHSDLKQMINNLNFDLVEATKEYTRKWFTDEQEDAKFKFNTEIVERYTSEANQLVYKFQKIVSQLFDVELKEIKEKFFEKEFIINNFEFSVDSKNPFIHFAEWLGRTFLGRVLGSQKKSIKSHIEEQCNEIIKALPEKLTKVIYAFSDAIHKSEVELKSLLSRDIEINIKTIERILNRTIENMKNKTFERAENEKEVDGLMGVVDYFEAELDVINEDVWNL